MITVCAFCNTVIHPGTSPDDPVSHGVCRSCSDHFLATHGIDLSRYLQMLNAPVLLVGSNVDILAANSEALRLIGKPAEKIPGNLAGKVFECRYSRLPGGCGQTIHCSGCAIRRSVHETWETGRPVVRCPAILNRLESGRNEEIHFYVSTRKEGGIVLLLLEPADMIS